MGQILALLAGADEIFAVTPAEHLGMPDEEQTRQGCIVAALACHSADLARGKDREMDHALSVAREAGSWKDQLPFARDERVRAAAPGGRRERRGLQRLRRRVRLPRHEPPCRREGGRAVKGRGTARFRLLWLVPVLLVAAGTPGQAAHSGTRSSVLAPGRIERDSKRFAILNTAALWEVLAIRPGMTVLDVGTGTGQFAYAFADRLQGRGKVYATDVNEGCVSYVQEQAAARGLGTVVPVLVRREGLDEFYRSDTYDLIAMFHVLMDYGKEWNSLATSGVRWREDGRLVLMLQKSFPDFTAADFTADHEGLVHGDHAGAPRHPVLPGLPGVHAGADEGAAGAGSAAAPVAAIVEDFNATLANANFGMDFFDGAAFRKDLDFTRRGAGVCRVARPFQQQAERVAGDTERDLGARRKGQDDQQAPDRPEIQEVPEKRRPVHPGAVAGGQGGVCARGVCPAEGVRRSRPLRGCSCLHSRTLGDRFQIRPQ